MDKDPKKLKGAALARELERIPFLRAWASAVEAHAMAELLAGRNVPGYKLVKSRPGHRRWTDEAKGLARLGEWNVPLDEVAPRPQGKVTIAAASDPRDPVHVEDWED